MITALLLPGTFPDVQGGFLSAGHCSHGTFHYEKHSIVIENYTTRYRIHIPTIFQKVTLTYCMNDHAAMIGAMETTVSIEHEALASYEDYR